MLGLARARLKIGNCGGHQRFDRCSCDCRIRGAYGIRGCSPRAALHGSRLKFMASRAIGRCSAWLYALAVSVVAVAPAASQQSTDQESLRVVMYRLLID